MVTGPSKVTFVKSGQKAPQVVTRPGPAGGKYVTEIIDGKTFTSFVPANIKISAGSARRGGAIEIVNTKPAAEQAPNNAPPQTVRVAVSYSDVERARSQFEAAGIKNASEFFAAVERGDVDIRGGDIYFKTRTQEPIQVTRREEFSPIAPRTRAFGETVELEPEAEPFDIKTPSGTFEIDKKIPLNEAPEGKNPVTWDFEASQARSVVNAPSPSENPIAILLPPLMEFSKGLYTFTTEPVADYFFTAGEEGYVKATEKGISSTASSLYQVGTHPLETLQAVGEEIFTNPFRASGEALGLYASGKAGGKVVEKVSPIKISVVTDDNLKAMGGPRTKGIEVSYPTLGRGEVWKAESFAGASFDGATLELGEANVYSVKYPLKIERSSFLIKNPQYAQFLKTAEGKIYTAFQEEGFELEFSSGGESPKSQAPTGDEGFSGGGRVSPFENRGGLNALVGPGGSGQVQVLAEETTFKVNLWKDATKKTGANLFITGANSRFMPTPTGFVNEITGSGVLEVTDFSKLGGVRSEVSPSVKIFEGVKSSPVVNSLTSSRVASSVRSAQNSKVESAVSVVQAVAQSQVQAAKVAAKLGLKSGSSQRFELTFPKGSKDTAKAGFDVFIRRKGVFQKINTAPLSKAGAFALGSYKAETTSAATFKVLPSKRAASGLYAGPSGSLSNFYRKNGAFIEKPGKRINTAGEKREIPGKSLFLTSFKPKRRANSRLGNAPTRRLRSKNKKKIFGVL